MERRCRLFLLLLLVFLGVAGFRTTFALAAPAQGVISFSDVPGHWAESDVMRLAALELVKGYPDRTFKPDQLVNRLEAVVLVIRSGGFAAEAEKKASLKARPARAGAGAGRAAGAAESVSAPTPWVPWGQAYLDLAVEKGFLPLSKPEDFDYADPATRLEVAALLARALYLVSPGAVPEPESFGQTDSPPAGAAALKSFSDEAAVPPADRVIIRAVAAAGVMTGYPDGAFRPLQPLTRAELAAVLSRLVDRGWVKTASGRRLAGWISGMENQKGKLELELTSLAGVQKLQVAAGARCYREGKEWPLERAANFRCEVILDGRRQVGWVNLLEHKENVAVFEKIRGSVKSVALGEDNLLVLSDMDCEDRVLPLAWDAVVAGRNARQGFKSLKAGDFVDVEVALGQVKKATVLEVKAVSGTVDRFDGRRLYFKEAMSGDRPAWFNYWDRARMVDKDGVKKGGVSVGDKVRVTYLDPFPGEIDDEIALEIRAES